MDMLGTGDSVWYATAMLVVYRFQYTISKSKTSLESISLRISQYTATAGNKTDRSQEAGCRLYKADTSTTG